MEHNHQKNLREQVLEKIRSKEISMRPKLYFTLQLAAMAVVAIAVLVISIFIVNFILFSVRADSHESLLAFGTRGIFVFLLFFPWELLVLDLALIALLQYLVRKFRFGYKIPILYLAAGLAALGVFAGLILDRGTPLNDALLREAQEHRLPPPLGDVYGRVHRSPPPGTGICKCTIIRIEGNLLTVQDTRSTTTLTIALPRNDPRATTTNLNIGDIVFVAGDLDDSGVIQAFGVRILPPRGPSGRIPLK